MYLRTKERRSYYSIKISRDELRIAYEHRCKTGEGIQTFVRRLIREQVEEKRRPSVA